MTPSSSSSCDHHDVVSKPNNNFQRKTTSGSSSSNLDNSDRCEDTEAPSDSDYSYGTIGYNILTDVDEEGVGDDDRHPRQSILRVRTQEESQAINFYDNVRNKEQKNSNNETTTEEEDSSEKTECHSNSNVEGSSEDNSNNNSNDTKVRFNDVEVREFPYCLGDNPSTNVGVPLTIGWEPQSVGRLSVDDYEASRPDRRCSEQLRIPSFMREQLLRGSGYSRQEIQEGLRKVNIARGQRRRTNETKQLQSIQEWGEKLFRGAKNATIRRNEKQKERKYLEQLKAFDASRKQPQLQQGKDQSLQKTWHGTSKTSGSSSTSTLRTSTSTTATGYSSSVSEPNLAATVSSE